MVNDEYIMGLCFWHCQTVRKSDAVLFSSRVLVSLLINTSSGLCICKSSSWHSHPFSEQLINIVIMKVRLFQHDHEVKHLMSYFLKKKSCTSSLSLSDFGKEWNYLTILCAQVPVLYHKPDKHTDIHTIVFCSGPDSQNVIWAVDFEWRTVFCLPLAAIPICHSIKLWV